MYCHSIHCTLHEHCMWNTTCTTCVYYCSHVHKDQQSHHQMEVASGSPHVQHDEALERGRGDGGGGNGKGGKRKGGKRNGEGDENGEEKV